VSLTIVPGLLIYRLFTNLWMLITDGGPLRHGVACLFHTVTSNAACLLRICWLQ